jgi:hypothetical protein
MRGREAAKALAGRIECAALLLLPLACGGTEPVTLLTKWIVVSQIPVVS